MPIDMTLPLYLSKEDFSYRKPRKTCKPALRFQHSHLLDQSELQDDRSISKNGTKTKKRVTFADHKGLALTRVKMFSPFSDPIDIPMNIQEQLSSALSLKAEDDRLVLGFAQPASDYLLFRQRLEENLICLEHCLLKEKAFAGTVKVRNVSFEKSVKVRVTFDSWKSHTDVDCVYMKDSYPSLHHDTFSFEVSVSGELKPHERIEFAVCYQVDGCEHWDSNQGNNYSITWSSMRRGHQQAWSRPSCDYGVHFDRYGSPTCSHGIFPDWPGYAGYENIGPYY
ncbi:protein phosphatase 1 regulatory subunit 3B [Astatotilapia calliptera]|uniref:Protein phosphatase 1 regulatory subunit n=1 Tax=Astatotilapia calliptera TaxID=8154 RepID=A0AAX7TX00_ASTCA|nr:protein phosphatase 1 regulatory subunit 3B [Maylandia zebra]XP_023009129.1 protein phosphatase 1 regulatory subunit 3B [Maylandia zebra]XP_026030447.1 protein phosphatase 1 regulatory subunit 3B [Astatotilapia calliptera]XP_026030448.1 protein phosphatase 1 regulatory subunit 3B [Astatotilapia calliptera]